VPGSVEVRVHDSTADLRYIVLPMQPSGTDGWSEKKLASIVTRDTMIGTAIPKTTEKKAARAARGKLAS
jgi:nitrile hydratase